jgi:hypothetical protein
VTQCHFLQAAASSTCALPPLSLLLFVLTGLWARPGYWLAADTDISVTQCAPPDPTARCERFDVASGAVRCGEPYLQVGDMLLVCAVLFCTLWPYAVTCRALGSAAPVPGDTSLSAMAHASAVQR